MDRIFNHFLTLSLITYNFQKNQYFFNKSHLNFYLLLSTFIIFLPRFRIVNTWEKTSFFDEIEDICDEIVHISRKRAHWMEMWALGFIFRYQKSALQCPWKSVSRRVWTLLVSIFECFYNFYFIMSWKKLRTSYV